MTDFDFTCTIEQLNLTLDCAAQYDDYLNVSGITVTIDGTDYDLDQSGLETVAVQSQKGQWVSLPTIITAIAEKEAEKHAELYASGRNPDRDEQRYQMFA